MVHLSNYRVFEMGNSPKKSNLPPPSADTYHGLLENVHDAIIFQYANDAILLHTLEGEILEVNPKTSGQFGYNDAELLKMNVSGLYAPGQAEVAARGWATLLENRFANFEMELMHKNGSRFPAEVSAVLFTLRGREMVHAIVRDMTRRQRAARLQAALYGIADRASYIEDMGEFYAAMHRIVGELMYADNFYIALYDEVRDLIICPYFVDEFDKEFPTRPRERKRAKGFTEHIVQTGEPLLLSQQMIEDMIRRGTVEQLGKIAVDWLGVPLKHGEKTFGALAVQSYREDIRYQEQDKELLTFVAQHISSALERKRYLEKLAAERKWLTVTLRSIGDGVITTDTDGRILMVNEVAEKLTGWPHSRAGGLHISEVFRIEMDGADEPAEAPLEKALSSGQLVEVTKCRLIAAQANTTVRRMISLSAAPIHDENHHIIGGVLAFRDITNELKAEQELQKAQRLESVGILAGGIAHDFNNILTAIIGNISMGKVGLAPESESYARLSVAEQACQRARDLTRQLLTFSKGGAPLKQVMTVEEVVRESATFALHGSKSRCSFEFAPDLLPIEADRGQIGQVINNIVINAVQAMPDGGQLAIRCRNYTAHKRGGAQTLPLRPGRYVEIAIKDEGVGIPEAYIQQVFDPYFSTKQQGSGLGLATCYSIVSKHGGFIAVTSRVGRGSQFTVYLPASARKRASARTIRSGVFRGKGRILVMDDEPSILDLMTVMLSHLGYKIVKARDGAEAVEIFRHAHQSGLSFAAVVMDLTVPGGMGGREALEAIRKIEPEVRAIVASGYANDPVMSNYRQFGFQGRIQKPFNLQEVSRVLQMVIPAEGD